jgi:anti-anti-sigma regulatory factor
MEDPQPLNVQCSRADQSAVITCRGSLVSENCERLQRAIDAALEEGVQRLRLDLAGVTVADASATHCIERTILRCESVGVGFTVQPWP